MQLIDSLDTAAGSREASASGNWVIAPIPFRNELLGVGIVLGAGYLYGREGASSDERHSVAALGGMYAEGGSWAGIGGHRGYWAEDRYRTRVGVVTGEILYNITLDLQANEQRIGLAQSFSGASTDVARRVGSKGWIGFGFLAGTTDIALRRTAETLPDALGAVSSIDLATVRLSGDFDTRDSDLYARSGRYVTALLSIAREKFSSDEDYETLEVEWNDYFALSDSQVLALRVAGKAVDGETPFFAKAWFGSGSDLRGYTPGRYIADSMFTAQAEWRWQASPRWGFVAFAGAGKVDDALGDIETDEWLPAAGAGIRFRLTQALPLNMRADFGWGREDSTFTLAVGEAF